MKLDLASLIPYAFWWTEVRLVVAAAALFLGGTPPVYWALSFVGLSGIPIAYTGLTVAWIISGASVILLAYEWHKGGMKLFGGMDLQDRIAFLVAVVSGINLGIVGLVGENIGMSITTNYIVFVVAGVLYLWSAYRLYTRFSTTGEKLF